MCENMNVKIFQELIKQDTQNSMKLVNVNVDYMQVFVMINKGVVKVNTDVNAKNILTKGYVIKDLIRILAIANVSLMNYVMLEKIQIIKKM